MTGSDLLQSYQQLSTLGQRIFEVMALCESKLSRGTLLDILKACGWGRAATKSGSLNQALVKVELKDLVVRGLAESHKTSLDDVAMAPPALDFGVQQAVLTGNFELISDVIEPFCSKLRREQTRGRTPERPVSEARRQGRIAFYRGDVAGFKANQRQT